MSALILRNHSHNNITIVENDFIDHYMVSANGEYVKVYLLLLRYQNIPEQLPDIPQMADLLENTEGDILRALKYWEKEGILSLEYDETNELAGICIGKAPTHQTPVKAAFHTPSAQSASVHEKSPVTQSDGNTTVSDKAAGQNLPASRRSLAARRELKQILFIAEQYLGKTLSRTDVDAVYKMDYNKVLEYHIAKKADITVVCRDLDQGEDATRFGILKMNENMRIEEFEEKPMVANSNTISTGIYIIRRRQLIDLIEHSAEEDRYDFVTDILIRYKNLKKIYGYKIKDYWSNISTVDAYYKTNMDFLKPEVRNYFFKQLPSIYSKVTDLPPAKYNPGAVVKNSLVASGSIINGTVENSVLFKKVFVGNNCVIKNSIILNDVYLGDNTYIENCIVESRDTIRANTRHVGEDGVKVVIEKNERYAL